MSMRHSSLKFLQLALGILVSLAAIVLTVRRVDIAEARLAFQEADYRWLIPAAALSVASVLCRAARWQTLFYPIHVKFGRVFGVLTIGQLITTLLPFRLGDFVRAYLVGDLERRSKIWALSTVVVERLLDIAVLVMIFVMLLPFVPIPAWAKSSVWIGGSGMLLVLLTLTLIAAQRTRAGALAQRWGRRIPVRWQQRLATLVSPAIDGLAALSNVKILIRALTWSVVAWVCGGLVMWATLIAFGFPHSFTVAMLLLVMSAVAVALPSSPGFVGVYHVVVIESLVFVVDVSHSAAASFAITTHILLFAPPVVFGLAYLWREPLILRRLLSLRRTSRHSVGERHSVEEPSGSIATIAD